MNTDIKYLKDENDNIFTPVVSTKSVFDSNGSNLNDCLFGETIFEGSNKSGNITFSKNLTNYRFITIIWRRNGSNYNESHVGCGVCYTIHPIRNFPYHVYVGFGSPALDANICQYTAETLYLTGTTLQRSIGCIQFGITDGAVAQFNKIQSSNTNFPFIITHVFAYK